MRNSLFLWSCLLLAIVSCKKESIDVAPYLRIPEEIKLLQYKQDAHSDHINIETNSSDWTISSNALWCMAERISDKQQMFRLTLAENEEPSIRQACLTFRLGQTTDSILVQQLGTTPAILLNPDSIEVESNGEEVEVIVTSNLGENGYDPCQKRHHYGMRDRGACKYFRGMVHYPKRTLCGNRRRRN